MYRQIKTHRLAGLIMAFCTLFALSGPVAASLLKPTQASPDEKPNLSIDFNVVRDARGKRTGFVELALVVQTPGDEKFTSYTTSLQYNSDVLQPVSWSLAPDATGKLTQAELNADAQALGLNGDRTYCGDIPVKGDDGTDGGTAHGGGPGYDDTLSDGATKAVFNALYFSAESRNIQGVAYPQATTLAVVRFYDVSGKFDTTGSGDSIKVTYDTNEVTPVNVTDFVRFTDDTRAKVSPAEQSVWYASAANQFYYVASYDGDPANLVDVPFNGATLKAPDTIGRKVLAVDAAGTETDPGYYSYTTNLLDRVPIEVSSKLSFNAGGGTDINNLATILFYDWDDSLLGTLTVEKGDARAEVNDYIESNFIHPDLKASTHIDAAYTDSTEREYSYRGTYPSVAPGKTGNSTVDANGYKYPLTNKLDYVFYKWATTKTVENDFADPSDSTNIIPQVNLWTTKPVSTETDAREYPYVNGWAKVENVKNMSDVWTTFGANGELRNCDPETGSFITYGDSSYFDFIDFSDLDSGVYYAKACYAQGPDLLDLVTYRIINGPYFTRYGTSASTDNATYSVKYQYERVSESSDGIRGVTRTREPAVQVQNYPDMMKADVENGFSQPFYSTVTVTNTDVMDVDITSAGGVWHFNYTLLDIYNKNIATGDTRSQTGNELSVPDNFLYDQVANDYNDRFGTDGLVFQATLHTLMYEGTMSVLGEDNAFASHANLATIQDLNFFSTTTGTSFNSITIQQARNAILDAIRGVYEKVGPTTPGGLPRDPSYFYEDGAVKLDWHQLQYHILNWESGGLFAEGGILSPSACGGFPWCNIDDCNGGAVTVTNLKELLDAGYLVYSGENPNALNTLTPTIINSLYLRSEDTGSRYTTVLDFKADLTTAIGKLVAPAGPYTMETVGSATWKEVQFALINGAFKSDQDIRLDPSIDFWWEGGQTPEITNLRQLLTVGYRVYVGHSDASMLERLTMDTVNSLYLRADVNGKRFADLDAFKAALENAVRTMASSGPFTAETIGRADWIVLQHLLIPGTSYRDVDSLRNDPTINYWWEAGNSPTVATAGDLMRLAYLAYGPGGDAAFIDNIDLLDTLEQLRLRSDVDGTKFITKPPAVSALKQALQALCLDADAPYTPDTLNRATWKETQYTIINYDYQNDESITDDYWWLYETSPPITDQASMLKYAYKVYVQYKDTSLLDGLSIDTVKDMWFAKDMKGTLYNDLPDFKRALAQAIKVLTAEGATPPYLEDNLNTVPWKELQYALIFGTYKKEAEIAENFYWVDGGFKQIESINDLLIAGYQVYGDKSNLSALDGLTEADIHRISNDPFWFRSEKENGTPFESMGAFKNELDKSIIKLKNVNYDLTNIESITWRQLQNLLLGNSYKPDAALVDENYWWQNNGEKPTSIDADAVIAEIFVVSSQLDQDYIGEETDETLLTVLIEKYVNQLKLRATADESSTYTSADIAELQAIIQEITSVALSLSWDNEDFTYADVDCYYAELTWNEVQYYILNGGNLAPEESIAGYDWRPGGSKPASNKLCNLEIPLEVEKHHEPEILPDQLPETHPVPQPPEQDPGELPPIDTPDVQPPQKPDDTEIPPITNAPDESLPVSPESPSEESGLIPEEGKNTDDTEPDLEALGQAAVDKPVVEESGGDSLEPGAEQEISNDTVTAISPGGYTGDPGDGGGRDAAPDQKKCGEPPGEERAACWPA